MRCPYPQSYPQYHPPTPWTVETGYNEPITLLGLTTAIQSYKHAVKTLTTARALCVRPELYKFVNDALPEAATIAQTIT